MSKTPKSFEDAIARLEELTQQIESVEMNLTGPKISAVLSAKTCRSGAEIAYFR